MVEPSTAIWLVWYPEDEPRYVYPCSVLQVVSSDATSCIVKLRYIQDNGVWDDPDEVALRTAALHDEQMIQHESRTHLDWAYRSKSFPGENNRLSRMLQRDKSSRPKPDRSSPAKRANTAPAPVSRAASGSHHTVRADVSRKEEYEALLSNCQAQVAKLEGEISELKGKFDAWDATVQRMNDYQRQQAMLAEEVRKVKRFINIDTAPGGPSDSAPQTLPATSSSDPLCGVCKQKVAYDMPLNGLMTVIAGVGAKVDLADMFTLPGGRVKASSPLKGMVQCDACMQKGALKLVVCTSGGAGNRLTCDWCRCRMTTNTTDAASMWCGKKHSNCRTLLIENETDRQGNTLFLSKGLAPVKEAVPWDDLKLIDVGLEQYNDADYVIVASSALGKALVILEIDNMSHSGGQYTLEAEKKKNDGNFASSAGFDRVLFVRINPSGSYRVADKEATNLCKKARWLIARDWIVTFLRAPYGSWTFDDKLLLYLFYDHDSQLFDNRPTAFQTVVTCKAPALPQPSLPGLADWACSLDPYLLTKGSAVAQACLKLDDRHPQPPRAQENT